MGETDPALRRFGRHLAMLRRQKGLSVLELADASGIDPRQIRQIERGRVNILVTTLLALARALDITPDQLLPFD